MKKSSRRSCLLRHFSYFLSVTKVLSVSLFIVIRYTLPFQRILRPESNLGPGVLSKYSIDVTQIINGVRPKGGLGGTGKERGKTYLGPYMSLERYI